MAHKVHPKSYRIRGMADWGSRGFYKNQPVWLEEDFRIREFLNKKLAKIGIEKVDIERFPGKINVIIFSARPGLIIGRGGEGAELLKKELDKKVFGKLTFGQILRKSIEKPLEIGEKRKANRKDSTEGKKEIKIEIREVKNPWISANLAGQWIAQQIEKRIPFRKTIKQGLSKIIAAKGAQGGRIEVSGRLDGKEIARREWLGLGQMPRQTIRADIDYARVEAHCTYGAIGIKVWIYKGERFD
ncbi:MAG: 30S ribosomal protein S3 [Candidatus Nealsonbacteria bacterium RIFCSPLOWO2_12_FULL_39_31]|uniref:Small ribosomal subunit protein uS3 n=2 Tax=Candidatus Nealsoniibacteriota TaxID=1817911 RepID=A0A1G2EMK4_9BACT|nr:MAG: 30S ribosomal protein S3 [Parcubacteria group bacterium GW2011_GWA2_38_27]KKQ96720.1 MAG: 30S ribosomal protein S3 [Parcubacteria group bacterium GW2011_GWC2_39_11]OGZ19497.1 MAG: 30S ribosomal protein S3 [Candidatus Nealsonbacteria bacterium RIFCSPHIGHO2_01_FULL_38_55]OGZ21111.1 MAG: 30S ribosomal protein S3 [Candidatus Nealsonbacteria bacterium RIFCSPHIGHO2_02_38_10]OGZ21536.1 MAG: 30S ribosomal protein S3 [Candidatus Nealsonbacteria bacterium RIFCSPHIGHO2_02_FULL_38_75]OGZ22808.1 MA